MPWYWCDVIVILTDSIVMGLDGVIKFKHYFLPWAEKLCRFFSIIARHLQLAVIAREPVQMKPISHVCSKYISQTGTSTRGQTGVVISIGPLHLQCADLFARHKDVFAFFIVSLQWNGTKSWNPSTYKRWTHVSYIVNIMTTRLGVTKPISPILLFS